MCNYKMLCLDIDGTLLNSDHQITKETKEAIRRVVCEKNVQVVLVSARMPRGIVFLQKELGIDGYIICYSGSLILDKNGNMIFNRQIDSKVTDDILKCANEFDVSINLYKDNSWIIEKNDNWSDIESDIVGFKPEIDKFSHVIDVNDNIGPNKILILGDKEENLKVRDMLKDKFEDYINIYPSKPTYLEIMNKDVCKTEAIIQLLKLLDIKQSEVIAIGDNFNDMDMIKFAEVGIAMGNAPEEVKSVSDYVTATNDEGGVAKAVYKYFIK